MVREVVRRGQRFLPEDHLSDRLHPARREKVDQRRRHPTTEVTDWVKTSSLTPDEILANFRTSFFPRIAVTVDMISTGTDVKPIECVFFMRNVKSARFLRADEGARRTRDLAGQTARGHAIGRSQGPVHYRRCRGRVRAGQDRVTHAEPPAFRSTGKAAGICRPGRDGPGGVDDAVLGGWRGCNGNSARPSWRNCRNWRAVSRCLRSRTIC